MNLKTMYGWGAVLAVALLVGILAWGFAAPPLPAEPTPQPTPLQLPPPDQRVPLLQTALANMRDLTSAHWEARLEAPTGSGSEIWQYAGDSDAANKTTVFTLAVSRSSVANKTPVPIGPPMDLMVRNTGRYYGNGQGSYEKVSDTGDHFEFMMLYLFAAPAGAVIPAPTLPITATLLPGTPEIETLDGVATFHFVAPQTELMFGQLLPTPERPTSQVEFWVAPGARPLLYQLRWSEPADEHGMIVLWRGSRFDATVPFPTPVIQEP